MLMDRGQTIFVMPTCVQLGCERSHMAEVSSCLLQRAGIMRNPMSMLIGEDDLRALAFASLTFSDDVLWVVGAKSHRSRTLGGFATFSSSASA